VRKIDGNKKDAISTWWKNKNRINSRKSQDFEEFKYSRKLQTLKEGGNISKLEE
jgi:hypothetical protein